MIFFGEIVTILIDKNSIKQAAHLSERRLFCPEGDYCVSSGMLSRDFRRNFAVRFSRSSACLLRV